MARGGVLAVDLGRRKTGFAVCDALRIAVEALPAARLGGDDPRLVDHLRGLLEERTVDVLLVGLPLHGDGSESEQSAWVRGRAAALAAELPGLRLVLHDEHLTTREAEARLLAAGVRGERLRALRDSAAAQVLLEDWLSAGEPGGA